MKEMTAESQWTAGAASTTTPPPPPRSIRYNPYLKKKRPLLDNKNNNDNNDNDKQCSQTRNICCKNTPMKSPVHTVTPPSCKNDSSHNHPTNNGLLSSSLEEETPGKKANDDDDDDYPTGAMVPFPYETPYPQQVALMDSLLQGLFHGKKLLLLESPTGTGKSLSLACAALAWLHHHEKKEKHKLNDINDNTPNQPSSLQSETPKQSATTATTTTTTSMTGLDWLDDWKPPQENEAKKKKKQEEWLQREMEQRQAALQKLLQELRLSSQGHPERRLNLVKQAVTQQKVMDRKLQRRSKQQQQQQSKRPRLTTTTTTTTSSLPSSHNRPPPLAYESEEDDETIHSSTAPKGSPAWLLESETSIAPGIAVTRRRRRLIIYAARTHSQLSQFVQEVQRTHWGPTTKVVTLASRSQGLCGYLLPKHNTTQKRRSDQALTEACLDLKKGGTKDSKNKCPYYHSAAMATLALHSLAQPTDLETLGNWGRSTQTCAYYASRQAISQADILVMPYNMLMDPSARQSWDSTTTNNNNNNRSSSLLKDALVLIDEAHNLPAAIANVTSSPLVSRAVLEAALRQLERYTTKYLDRLSHRHLQSLAHLRLVVQGILSSLKNKNAATKTTTTTTTTTATTTTTKTVLQSPTEFICHYGLAHINLFPLLRYLKESRLSQKLLGFMDPAPTTTTTTNSNPKKTQENPSNNNKQNEKERSDPSSGEFLSSHISPMSVVEGFLQKLVHYENDGKIVIRHETETVQYVVLNPAVHAQDDVWTQAAAVCLVGGTLQPLDALVQELVPSLGSCARQAQHEITKMQQQQQQNQTPSSPKTSFIYSSAPPSTTTTSSALQAFSCGHVVDPSHVLLQAITHIDPNVKIDVRHQTRSTPQVCHAIGKSIWKLCQTVPHGVVVFVPSYAYEKVLVEAWKKIKQPETTRTLWDDLQQVKPIFREPSQASALESTLESYAKAAKTQKGALLLSVMGGKLSEGINFANELCRCVVVVGLPFPDKSDLLLQEKLRLVESSSSSSTKNVHKNSAANDYYLGLCLRSVNQSIGRAIRHANDYAAIVLMDVRYPIQESIIRGLPQWVTSSTPEWRHQPTDLYSVLPRIRHFFTSHGATRQQEKRE